MLGYTVSGKFVWTTAWRLLSSQSFRTSRNPPFHALNMAGMDRVCLIMWRTHFAGLSVLKSTRFSGRMVYRTLVGHWVAKTWAFDLCIPMSSAHRIAQPASSLCPLRANATFVSRSSPRELERVFSGALLLLCACYTMISNQRGKYVKRSKQTQRSQKTETT